MPKSRKRKGAKPYRYKPIGSVYSVPEPLALFRVVGRGKLEHDEEEAACQLLLKTMGAADEETAAIFKMRGIDWPPQTSDDIRTIGKLLVEIDEEQSSGATH